MVSSLPAEPPSPPPRREVQEHSRRGFAPRKHCWITQQSTAPAFPCAHHTSSSAQHVPLAPTVLRPCMSPLSSSPYAHSSLPPPPSAPGPVALQPPLYIPYVPRLFTCPHPAIPPSSQGDISIHPSPLLTHRQRRHVPNRPYAKTRVPCVTPRPPNPHPCAQPSRPARSSRTLCTNAPSQMHLWVFPRR